MRRPRGVGGRFLTTEERAALAGTGAEVDGGVGDAAASGSGEDPTLWGQGPVVEE